MPVSYTHLDVYKRQQYLLSPFLKTGTTMPVFQADSNLDDLIILLISLVAS